MKSDASEGRSSSRFSSSLAVLRALDAASDVFPLLKGVCGLVLHIADSIDKFRANREEWKEFSQHVQDLMLSLVLRIAETSGDGRTIESSVSKLYTTLAKIDTQIRRSQSKSLAKRFWSFQKTPDFIGELSRKLGDAIASFQLDALVALKIDTSKLLELYNAISIEEVIQKANGKLVMDLVSMLKIDSLPTASNSSWSQMETCLEGTRENIVHGILAWIEADTPSAEVYLLSGVAGSGKSAIAHTVAQSCSQRGILGSSFFFDSNIDGRNDCSMIYTTIAKDLSHFSRELSMAIRAASSDHSSAFGGSSVSWARQFQTLLFEPLQTCATVGPMVIVLDALDEGYNADIIRILRDDIKQLPATLRFLVTTRPLPDIIRPLSVTTRSHIRVHQLELNSASNRADMSKYIRWRMADIAEQHHLVDWPRARQLRQFQIMADGLFVWAARACDHILDCDDPRKELKTFLSPESIRITLMGGMDALYTRIIGACPWNDLRFSAGYKVVIGAIMNAKTPLSVSTLDLLFPIKLGKQTVSARQILLPMQSLFGIIATDVQPIHTLHLSFKEFLQEPHRFSVDTTEVCAGFMALGCIRFLDKSIRRGITGLGYLNSLHKPDSHHTYEIPRQDLSPALQYASEHWLSHLLSVPSPVSPTLLAALRTFIRDSFPSWLELSVIQAKFQPLEPLRRWILDVSEHEHDLMGHLHHRKVASTLHALGNALGQAGRPKEALDAVEDAVLIRRLLAQREKPSIIAEHELACSLNRLCARLCVLNRMEHAILAAEQAVALFRSFTPNIELLPFLHIDIANSLHSLARCAVHVQQVDVAHIAVSDAIRLNKTILDRSDEDDDDLAMFLGTSSAVLCTMNHWLEAVKVSAEAVEVRKRLSDANPTAISLKLRWANTSQGYGAQLISVRRNEEGWNVFAEVLEVLRGIIHIKPAAVEQIVLDCLQQASRALSHLGRHQESIEMSIEAIGILRKRAEEDPVTHLSSLANCLVNLSTAQGDLGQHQAALERCEEGVEMLRTLSRSIPMYREEFVASLRQYHICLRLSGQDAVHALDVLSEAATVAKKLAEEDLRQGQYYPAVLSQRARHLRSLGRLDEARPISAEAVLAYRNLLQADVIPQELRPNFAMLLSENAQILSQMEDYEEALASAQEAIVHLQERVITWNDLYNSCMVESQNLVDLCLVKLKQDAQSVPGVLEGDGENDTDAAISKLSRLQGFDTTEIDARVVERRKEEMVAA